MYVHAWTSSHMNTIITIVILMTIIVFVVYNMTKPFGWQSPLLVRFTRTINLNAEIPVLFVGWKKNRGPRSQRELDTVLEMEKFTATLPVDIIGEIQRLDLPRGVTVLCRMSDGTHLEIHPFEKPRMVDDVLFSTGDHVAYAVVDVMYSGETRETNRRLELRDTIRATA